MVKKKVVSRNLSLHTLKFALACGIVTAVTVLLTTIAGMWGYFPFSNMIILDIYGRFGHSLELPRALLATVYSFLDAFIGAWIFAAIYNKLIE